MLQRAARIACLLLLATSVVHAGLLAVPTDYTPAKSWPVIVSLQDNPSKEQMATVPYFLIHAGGKGARATAKIRAELKALAKRYNIDPLRIYGTGFSRGGQEVLIQAWQHPHWFAAIAPVCSDLREKPDRNNRHLNVQYLVNVPTLMLHGEHDNFRQTGLIEFNLAKKAGCPVKWQTYSGGHSPALPFKQNVKLLTSFFDKHRLNPYPKKVVHLVEHPSHSRAFWADAALVKVTKGVKGVFTVEITKPNRIEVKANEHIASLDLYLTAKLVDMAKPVTVVAGTKTLYKGKAIPKLSVKLRDGEAKERKTQKPLWQELLELRAKAKAKAKAGKAAKPE